MGLGSSCGLGLPPTPSAQASHACTFDRQGQGICRSPSLLHVPKDAGAKLSVSRLVEGPKFLARVDCQVQV